MSLKNREELLIKFKKNEKDCGSVEVQVITLTDKILQLTGHASSNPKDYSSKLGLVKLVSKRKRFLDYVKKHNEPIYRELISALGLRK